MTPQALITGQPDPARTLVVVFLRGAADGLALVPPLEDDNYQRARPRLGIAKKDAVPLDGFYGLHPKMSQLGPAFAEGDLAGRPAGDEREWIPRAWDTMEIVRKNPCTGVAGTNECSPGRVGPGHRSPALRGKGGHGTLGPTQYPEPNPAIPLRHHLS